MHDLRDRVDADAEHFAHELGISSNEVLVGGIKEVR